MAEPVSVTTLSVWSEDSVRLETVLDALEELRRPEPMPATRTSVLTLCIVGADDARVARARAAVHELGGRHPARVLHLVLDPAAAQGPPGIDARIRLLGGESGGQELWFEDVELVVHGPATAHLDSILEPLTLADLPVIAWFVDAPPSPDDPILGAADVLLVDSRELGGLECFDTLSALVRGHPVVDLSWVRLRPWRELLAGLFEGPDFGPFVHAVRRVTVAGRTGPRHLIGGWLLDRLGLPRSALHLDQADHVSIRLHAERSDGRTARFEAVRGDERRVEARADVAGGPTSAAV
ncbi:MAG TPA: glucose-6-phosphate dehydrogenase assembly protein OpcA, partial [Acidimicrobiales bacterium]|nr:glucose-6-phosphate dehydrogenase assembly protein OpcA [Acidimicrobiales bacterium]